MKFRSKLAVRCAKATNKLIKKLNKGSGVTLPGYVARIIDPKILTVMAEMIKEKTIVTMGTNGKTTTNSILYHALTDAGNTVICNRTGANMRNGIISAFVLATEDDCRLKADYACIEVDEIASVRVLPLLKPDCALLTNISRDQLDRFGEVDLTYQTIKTAYDSVPSTTLIINCDDVLSYSFLIEGKNPHVTYGISDEIFDDISRSEIRESIFCRNCSHKLEYDFFHYGQLGMYHCSNCGLKRPTPDYTATQIKREHEVYSFTIDDMEIHSSARTPYNIYNTLSAVATLKALKANVPHLKQTLENFDYGNNRESIFNIKNKQVHLHLSKNPIGFQQKISLILKDKGPKDIIIFINDTYQDGEDVSWLWDVDFQYLSDANVGNIITTGSRRYDMSLRLKYEDIPCTSTTDMEISIQKMCNNDKPNLYIIVNYSGLFNTNRLLSRLEKEGNT
ncbi:MAG: MurT ligase domain-containing protein [Lachnospiraceae bacterium]|nr:MurT ligase domain-containing protein [Lachnospiraceae bacterium]